MNFKYFTEPDREDRTLKSTDETAIFALNEEDLQSRCENSCDDFDTLAWFFDANIGWNLEEIEKVKSVESRLQKGYNISNERCRKEKKINIIILKFKE